MASLNTSYPSEVFLSDPERRERQRRKQAMLEFYQKNDCIYVGELTINQCWGKIRGWINVPSLMGHLMKNGLVNNADEMDEISSPYLTAAAKQTNLMRLLKANGGGNGHFLFYMSLCESLDSNPLGHGDAVDELKSRAMELQEMPPWQRESNRNTSFSSVNSYSSLSSTDTSFEAGPQSLPTMSSGQTPTSSSSSLSMDSSRPSASGQDLTTPISPNQSMSSGLVQSSATGLSQPSAAQPKLDPAHTSMPPNAQVVYSVSGKKNILHSAGANNVYLLNKEAYTSNEPLSYSSTSSSGKTWTTPRQETEYWPDDSYPSDMDVERDSTSRQRQTTFSGDGHNVQDDTAKAMKWIVGTDLSLAKIEELVSSGNIDSLSEKYDNVLDLECTTEENSSDFMDNVCRFVCAVLNTRNSKRVGVLLCGVKETHSDRQPYYVEGVAFDEAVVRSIQQNFTQRLATVLRVRVGDLEKELTAEEISQATLKFVESSQTSEHCKCLVALLMVEPNLEVCKNHMYMCQFRDSSGRTQTECYKRLEGETVHIRQLKKITTLKNVLNQN